MIHCHKATSPMMHIMKSINVTAVHMLAGAVNFISYLLLLIGLVHSSKPEASREQKKMQNILVFMYSLLATIVFSLNTNI